MKQLRNCLEVIQDDEHVIDCCIKATPPTFEDTLDLLNYARIRVSFILSQAYRSVIESCRFVSYYGLMSLLPCISFCSLMLPLFIERFCSQLNNSKPAQTNLVDEANMRQTLLTNILETLHRLATYQIAFGIHNFRQCICCKVIVLARLDLSLISLAPSNDVVLTFCRSSEWEKFLQADMLREFLRHLGQGNLEIAFTLWRRHQVWQTSVFFP